MTTSGLRPTAPISAEELFRAHAPFVARLLTRLGVPPDELDDAVQEVFLVVHRNGGYVPGPATPTGYLTSIALRAASTHRRRGRKRRERRSEVSPDEVSSSSLDPARSLEVNQSLSQMQDALDELEPDMRATFVLAELEGESCPSIAATMQIAVGTVYWRLHHARKSFRAAIQNRRAAEGLAAGAVLFGPSADGLLDAARAHPNVGFDVEAAFARLRAALRSGTSIPPWAAGATQAGFASGVGVTTPAMLSAILLVHAAAVGVSGWHAKTSAPSGPVAAANLAAIAPALPAAPVVAAAPPTGAIDTAAPPAAVAAPASTDAHSGDVLVQRNASLTSARPQAAHPAAMEVVAAPPLQSPAPPTAVGATAPSDPLSAVNFPAPADSSGPDAMREIRDVAEAQRLLTTDPARALALVRSSEVPSRSTYLREERRYIGVIALFKLGRADEAHAEAARFLADYPDGPYSARVRAAR